MLLHELNPLLVHDPRGQARGHAALQVLPRDAVRHQAAGFGVKLGRQVVVEQVPEYNIKKGRKEERKEVDDQRYRTNHNKKERKDRIRKEVRKEIKSSFFSLHERRVVAASFGVQTIGNRIGHPVDGVGNALREVR